MSNHLEITNTFEINGNSNYQGFEMKGFHYTCNKVMQQAPKYKQSDCLFIGDLSPDT